MRPVIDITIQEWQRAKLGPSVKRDMAWAAVDIYHFRKAMESATKALKNVTQAFNNFANHFNKEN